MSRVTSKMVVWLEGRARAGKDITFGDIQRWAAANGADPSYRRAVDAMGSAKRRLQRIDKLLFRNVTKGGFGQIATYRIVNDSEEDYRRVYEGNRLQAAAFSKAADGVLHELNDGYFEPEISQALQPLVGEHIAIQWIKLQGWVALLPEAQKARAYGMFMLGGPE